MCVPTRKNSESLLWPVHRMSEHHQRAVQLDDGWHVIEFSAVQQERITFGTPLGEVNQIDWFRLVHCRQFLRDANTVSQPTRRFGVDRQTVVIAGYPITPYVVAMSSPLAGR